MREVDSAAANSLGCKQPVGAESDHMRTTSAPEPSPTANGPGRAAIGNPRYGNGNSPSAPDHVVRSPAPMPTEMASSSSGGALGSRRSRPNLRITVTKDTIERPPPPPPKSARHHQKGENHDSRSPVTQSHQPRLDLASDCPVSPLTQQHPLEPPAIPVVRAPESHATPASRTRRNFWPKIFPREESSTKRSLNSYGSSPVRPKTAGAIHSTVSPESAVSRLPGVPKIYANTPLNASNVELRSHKSADRLRSERTPESPPPMPSTSMADHRGFSSKVPHSRFQAPPAAQNLSPARVSPTDDRQGIADAIREHSRENAGNQKRYANEEAAPSESLIRPDAKTALAIARAKVAALRNPSPSADNLGQSDKERSSGSELEVLHGAIPAETLDQCGSPMGVTDPIATLKDLSQQCDALHTRYASLRVERQRLSSGIIEKLKEQRTDTEHRNSLLNDQLSLASVGSSMDICFAKLKSLDCRKEEAISALIAQTTHETKPPGDNIAVMIASMTREPRKSSVAPSTESESPYALTGQSTPDSRRETFFADRSTQSSFLRTLSFTSETASLKHRLSLSSFQNDAADVPPAAIAGGIEIPANCVRPREIALSQRHEDTDKGLLLAPTTYTPPQSGTYENPARRKNEERPAIEHESYEGLSDPPKTNFPALVSKFAHSIGVSDVSSTKQKAPNVNVEVRPINSASGKALSLLPVYPTGTLTTAIADVGSPVITDLTAQLENFPKPFTPMIPHRGTPKKELPILAPLAANPPTPVATTFGERFANEQEHGHDVPIMPPPRRDSLREMTTSTRTVGRSMTQGSARTTHTIQVFIEQDGLELLDLYRRSSEERAAAAARALRT